MNEGEIDKALAFAKELALQAADISLPLMGRASVQWKRDATVVTDADRRIQDCILRAIRSRYPDHALIGEEAFELSGASLPPGEVRYCWIVDPLDGTRNFVAGIPIFATSLALLDDGRPCAAVVVEHNRRQVFAAKPGGGSTLDGTPIRVNEPGPGQDALVAIPSNKDAYTVKVVQTWAAEKRLVCRNLGATALHLALVASGSFAGAFARRCRIWDVAAGCLLVTEAGGCITDPSGRSLLPFALDADSGADVPFLAGSPRQHASLLGTLGKMPISVRSQPPDRRRESAGSSS